MKVKANRAISYGGKEHAPGDEIEMDETTAKVNIFNGRVTPVKQGSAPPRVEKTARETLSAKKAKKPKHDEPEDEDTKEKGKYRRRDVRAEDKHEGDD